ASARARAGRADRVRPRGAPRRLRARVVRASTREQHGPVRRGGHRALSPRSVGDSPLVGSTAARRSRALDERRVHMTAQLAPLQTDPWAPRLVDVERLNGHASTLLSQRLDAVRVAAARGELLPTTSIVLLGAAGAGKTHIFARLRRLVGGRASFVLVRPLL